MEIGDMIKKERKKRGLTQKEIAEKLNISRNYLSDIEHNRYLPSLKLLKRISSFLECEFKITESMSEIQTIDKSN